MKPTVTRQIHARYTLLRAELFQVDQAIEANMDADPKAFNLEAKDIMLRKERDRIMSKLIVYRR